MAFFFHIHPNIGLTSHVDAPDFCLMDRGDQLIENQKIDLLLIIECARVLTNKKIRYLVASVSAGDQSLPKLCCPSQKTCQSVYCSLFHLCVCISLDNDEHTDDDDDDQQRLNDDGLVGWSEHFP